MSIGYLAKKNAHPRDAFIAFDEPTLKRAFPTPPLPRLPHGITITLPSLMPKKSSSKLLVPKNTNPTPLISITK